jgi:hypothetical protein
LFINGWVFCINSPVALFPFSKPYVCAVEIQAKRLYNIYKILYWRQKDFRLMFWYNISGKGWLVIYRLHIPIGRQVLPTMKCEKNLVLCRLCDSRMTYCWLDTFSGLLIIWTVFIHCYNNIHNMPRTMYMCTII